MIFNVNIFDNFCGFSQPLRVEAENKNQAKEKVKQYIKAWNISGHIESITETN